MVAVFSFCGLAVINTDTTLAFSALPTISSLLTWADFGKKGNHITRRKPLIESGWDGQKLTPTFKDLRGGRHHVQFGAFPNGHTWISLRSTQTQPTHRQLSWRSLALIIFLALKIFSFWEELNILPRLRLNERENEFFDSLHWTENWFDGL